MPTCRWWRLTHTNGNPRYYGKHPITHHGCTNPNPCQHKNTRMLEGYCDMKGQITVCQKCGCTEFIYHADRRCYQCKECGQRVD